MSRLLPDLNVHEMFPPKSAKLMAHWLRPPSPSVFLAPKPEGESMQNTSPPPPPLLKERARQMLPTYTTNKAWGDRADEVGTPEGCRPITPADPVCSSLPRFSPRPCLGHLLYPECLPFLPSFPRLPHLPGKPQLSFQGSGWTPPPPGGSL